MARIGKLVVVGVGLIGGSFALALKEAGAVGRVTGVGRGGRNIRRALELKIIDAAGAFDRATFADADLALLAAVSHLPHVLAYALVDQVARHKDAKQLFSFAAGGFRDFTRIAASHPEMWRDICLANRKALLVELRRYGGELERVKRMLERGDARALEALFSGARAARDRWLTDDNRDGE